MRSRSGCGIGRNIMRLASKWALTACLILTGAGSGALAASETNIAAMDLSKPFATRAPWRFTARQGPDVEDPGGNDAPGAISLCLTRDNGKTCHSAPGKALRLPSGDDSFAEPHYIDALKVVHPRPGAPLLLLQVASFHAGNGDQRAAMQLYAYDRSKDDFVLAYEHRTGRNNNQEIRFVEQGPLRGDIISSEPTSDAPFGYWITVNRLSPTQKYEQILHFRSATTYGDGNPLAVIDSEMPNIHRRLGLWRSGMSLPLPARACPRPHLVNGALWCS